MTEESSIVDIKSCFASFNKIAFEAICLLIITSASIEGAREGTNVLLFFNVNDNFQKRATWQMKCLSLLSVDLNLSPSPDIILHNHVQLLMI